MDASQVDEDDARLVYTPVRIGGIIRRLEQDAVKGSATAARELREWLRQYPPQDEGFDVATLDRRLRAKLVARLLAEIEADERDALQTSEIPTE